MVFYRKYRPKSFSEIAGQEEISKTLLSQLTSGKIGHAYLFWGPKGTGKTSMARILAKAVNCEKYGKKSSKYGEPCDKCANCLAIADGSFIDLIEIDGASNRGIDEVRDLREKVKLSPAVGRFKVYIIDEVHMLTNEAFNALLKTLEEPPAHVIFILATTEYAKLPQTIVSRLMRFNFKRASLESLEKALLKIVKAEKINIEPDAIKAICESSDGSFRDAVSILDQVSASSGKIVRSEVSKLLRLSGQDRIVKLLTLLSGNKLKESVEVLTEFSELGLDLALYVRQMILFLEKLLLLKIGSDNVDLGSYDQKATKILIEKISFAHLRKLLSLMVVAEGEMKLYPSAHIPVVLALCTYCDDVFVEPQPEAQNRDEVAEVENEESEQSEEKTEVVKKEVLEKPSKKITAGEVEKSWEEFLNRVRPVNAHVFALLRATRPASLDGDLVTLEVFYRFHKDKLEEPKIIKMLDEQMAQILGRKVRLKFTLADRESKPTLTVSKSDLVEGSEEDLEKIAREIFSK